MHNKVSRRQKKAIKGIEEGKSLRKAMLGAGYAENYANKGYRFLESKNIEEYMLENKTTEEEKKEVIAWFKSLRIDCKNKKDFSNSLRANEALARVNAMFTDKQEIKADITQDNPFTREIRSLTLNKPTSRIPNINDTPNTNDDT